MTQPGDAADARDRWRGLAGNHLMYDAIGAAQFSLLTLFFGLREHHKLLEIGAGSLRAARLLIPYLDAGNYCGVEPNEEAVQLGLRGEVGDDMVARKQPRFTARTDFGFHEFGERFDFVLSYSLFTHVPPGDIPTIFANVARVSHPDTVLLATAAFAKSPEEERIVDAENWTMRPINRYAFERLEREAATHGGRMVRLGGLHQDWFAVFRDDNAAALRAAREMRVVAWDQLTPSWQDPGWDGCERG